MELGRRIVLGALLAASVAACSGGGPTGGQPAGQGGSPMGSRGLGGSGGTAGSATGGASAGSSGAGGMAGAGTGGSAGGPAGCVPLAPLPRRILPLVPAQYGNATRDLLGLTAVPSVQVPGVPTPDPRPAWDVYVDNAYLLALYDTAGTIATQVVPMATALAACNTGETDADCATRFARTFGGKAFRRALDDVEVTDVLNVFAAVCPGPSPSCASRDDFAAAIGLMVKAFILAPSFLYRTELGPRTLTANAAGAFPDTTLTADELATQLAFMLLGSTPDPGLLAAASSGALATPAGILSEVNRLLALPAAQANVTAMVTTWLGVDRLPLQMKDPALLSPLPGADQTQLVVELRASWDRSVAQTLWSTPAGKVSDLLTSQAFFADWNLATLYGVAPGGPSASTLYATSWPTVQQRAGILTHPAFLWPISSVQTADIVRRGKQVYANVVCQDTVGPEPELTTPEAMAVESTGDSEVTQSDARLASGKLCADNCHNELDPYGRLLHAFDPIGNYRTVDEAGRPIDPSVTLTANSPLGAMKVSGPGAFASVLVSKHVFTDCAMQRLFEAALSTMVSTRDTCQIDQLRAQFDQSDGTMASLLGQIAASNMARARAGDTP